MSNSQWQSSARSPGTITTGSKKARQVLGTTQPRPFLLSPDKTILDSKVPKRVKLKMPIGLVDQRNKKYVVKSGIPRPRQATQWSLNTLREREQENIRRYQEQSQISIGKNVSPRKPKRPKYIPSPVDTAKLHEKISIHQNLRSSSARQLEEGSIFELNSQNTQFSRISSPTSSHGSIPDFPAPSNSRPAQLSLHASSSSAAKRVISSFYSRPSMISTTNEEFYTSRTSSYHTYASSAALPSTFRGSVEMPKTNRNPGLDASSSSKSIDSKTSNTGLARELSLLKISNVGMALTSNSDIELSKPKSIAAKYEKKIGTSGVEFKAEGATSLSSSNNKLEHNSKSRLESSKGIEYSNLQFPSTLGIDPAKKEINDDSECANYFSTKSSNTDIFDSITGVKKVSSKSPKFHQDFEAQKSTFKIPNALKQTDQKLSVASLYDLIRYASKFIAQIDRGKELEKRALFNNNYNGTYTKKDIYYEQERDIKNRSPTTHLEYGVYQDFLNDEKSVNVNFKFPKPVHKRNRCCGLPVVAFVVLTFIFIIIIAAAILIPLFFFVFHKQRMISRARYLDLCTTTKTSRCQNGGSSFLLDDDTCACICTNNFTGKTCNTIIDSSACSSITLAGQRVIIGSSVERLIVDANKNFSVPLNTDLILANFNTASLSCLAENALITYNGKSFREDDADFKSTRILSAGILKKSELLKNNYFASDAKNLISNMESISIVDFHDNSSTLSSSSLDSKTTDFEIITPNTTPSIISSNLSSEDSSTTTVTVTIAPSVTPLVPTPSISYGPSLTTTQISSDSPQSTIYNTFPSIISSSNSFFSVPSTPSATSTLLPSIYVANEITLDFARVVTLFILQNTDLNQAINAQISFQKVFSDKFITYSTARNLTLSKKPNTITVDLLHLSVDLGDGAGIFGGTVATSNNTF